MKVPVALVAALAFGFPLRLQAQVSFEDFHPDIAGREAGLRAHEAGDFETARHEFERSASYGDKGSQAMLAEIHWRGEGVARDPCVAYVWADLAAEREYPLLAGLRERYWSALSKSERQCALERGPQYYQQFGDEVAKPRLETRRLRNLGYNRPRFERDQPMATGWAGDGAVQEQIDATVKDAIQRARSQLPSGPERTHCEECEAPIPRKRRQALPGVRLCVACQSEHDREANRFAGYNRRGSKDSQLR